jgi:hypothetical protein
MTATFRAAFVLLTTVVFLGIAVCGEVVSRIFRTFGWLSGARSRLTR